MKQAGFDPAGIERMGIMPQAEKFSELLIAKCVEILISGEGNEKTVDAIWDLEVLGVDVSTILNSIKK